MTWIIHQGDWIERLREMPDESVHCVVTSPPYWGLRDYGVLGQLGLESTPDGYVRRMVEGFRELRRVLRVDGTVWLNVGDCYNQGNKGNSGEMNPSYKQASNHGSLSTRRGPMLGSNRNRNHEGLKPKDLVMMPARLALALQADGWWLRCDIIWSKPNQFPESVTDRPTRAHEYIFLLTRSEKYFYDAEAIKEPLVDYLAERIRKEAAAGMNGEVRNKYKGLRGDGGCLDKQVGAREHLLESGRNKRSVWEIATTHFPDAHFATFPPSLVEPCILAGTSERGCCAKCEAPRTRILSGSPGLPRERDELRNCPPGSVSDGRNNISGKLLVDWREEHPVHTIGWEQSCGCDAGEAGDAKPCTVLDPFAGAGTTGLVALRYQRNFIGIELKQEYCEMARRRIEQDAPLFNKETEREGVAI